MRLLFITMMPLSNNDHLSLEKYGSHEYFKDLIIKH